MDDSSNPDNNLVLVDIDTGVMTIQLNRPAKKNALNLEMYRAMTSALNSAVDDVGVRVILLTGSEGCFTSGNDLADFANASDLLSENNPIVAAVWDKTNKHWIATANDDSNTSQNRREVRKEREASQRIRARLGQDNLIDNRARSLARQRRIKDANKRTICQQDQDILLNALTGFVLFVMDIETTCILSSAIYITQIYIKVFGSDACFSSKYSALFECSQFNARSSSPV